MKDFRITIPEPCQENWNAMHPNANGRHCNSCNKTVIDFTQKTPGEIKHILGTSTTKVCGRFNTADLYQPVVTEAIHGVKTSWLKSKWLAMVAVISVFGFGKKASGQKVGQVAALPQAETKSTCAKKSATVLHGWIRCTSNKKGIAKAEIRVYSGGKEIAFSRSFSNGSYFIYIPEDCIWDLKVDLEYNAVHYHSRIFRDLPVQKERAKLDVHMAKTEVSQPIHWGVTMGGPMWSASGEEGLPGYPGVDPPVTVGQIENMSVGNNELPSDSLGTSIVKEEEAMFNEEKKYENAEPEVNSTDFSVNAYPNPSSGIFHININNSERTEIFVFDVSGRLLENKKTSARQEIIDMSSYPNGNYVVRVVSLSHNKVKQLKLIKLK